MHYVAVFSNDHIPDHSLFTYHAIYLKSVNSMPFAIKVSAKFITCSETYTMEIITAGKIYIIRHFEVIANMLLCVSCNSLMKVLPVCNSLKQIRILGCSFTIEHFRHHRQSVKFDTPVIRRAGVDQRVWILILHHRLISFYAQSLGFRCRLTGFLIEIESPRHVCRLGKSHFHLNLRAVINFAHH